MDFRDSALVDSDLEWKRGFLSECFGDIVSFEDLDIDMTEDPEWTNMFINEYLGDRPTSVSKPGSNAINYNKILSQDNASWIDQLSPNTVVGILGELGDFIPRPTITIEQTGGGVIEDSMPPPTIEVDEGTKTLPSPALIQPYFFLSNSALHHAIVYTANFGDPFNSLMSGGIVTDPMAITHSYFNKLDPFLNNRWGCAEGGTV